MIYKLFKEGDYCKKNLCVAGYPKCDKCPRNLYRKDRKGGTDRRYVKCASWMTLWLAEAIKVGSYSNAIFRRR